MCPYPINQNIERIDVVLTKNLVREKLVISLVNERLGQMPADLLCLGKMPAGLLCGWTVAAIA